MNPRTMSLVKNNYSTVHFIELPLSHKMAIVWFMAVDGEAWEIFDSSPSSFNELKLSIKNLMHRYDEKYGSTTWSIIDLDVKSIKNAIMSDPEISHFNSWDEYHYDYLSCDTPFHSPDNRWPIILSDNDEETIRDGWHRFHSYVRNGDKIIPAIF